MFSSLQNDWMQNFSTTMNRNRNDIVRALNEFKKSTNSDSKIDDGIIRIYDRYFETMYGTDSSINMGVNRIPLQFYMNPIINHYGNYSVSVEEWRSIILNLRDMGVQRILSVASGSAGMETLLYIFSKYFLDEQFEIIATDGYMSKTSPDRSGYSDYNDNVSLDYLPVQRSSASQAIKENHNVDAYFATMLPMDSHFQNGEDECPGECIANAAVVNNRPMIVFGEYEGQCTGTERFWDVVSNKMTEKHNINFTNMMDGLYFHASIYFKNDSEDNDSDENDSDENEND